MKTNLIAYLIALGIGILGASAFSSCGDMGSNNMGNSKKQPPVADGDSNHN